MTENRPFIIGINQEKREAKAFQPNCMLWSCPYCSEIKSRYWQVMALNGTNEMIGSGYTMAFVTLTSKGGKGRTRERALAHFKENWPKLRKVVRYWQGEFEYILVPEQHQNGILHVHLICNSIMTERFWIDYGCKTGFGYKNTCEYLQNAGKVPWYIAKYLGKQFCTVQWPKGFRRARKSANWPKLPDNQTDEQEQISYEVFMEKGGFYWELHLLRDAGYKLEISDDLNVLID